MLKFRLIVEPKPGVEAPVSRLSEPDRDWDLKFHCTSGALGGYEDLENIRELLMGCGGPFEIGSL
ncbi:MAG: hypothetical protein AAF493_03540 [Pseudomonadota bacterium]